MNRKTHGAMSQGSTSFMLALLLGLGSPFGCSSSDDVVAIVDGSSPGPGSIDPVSSDNTPTADDGLPQAGTDPSPVSATGIGVSAPSEVAPSAGSMIFRGASADSSAPGLFVAGVPRPARVEDAEPWPLAEPPREVFAAQSPSNGPIVVEVVDLAAAQTLRELGQRYGLDTGVVARLVVEGDAADQYDLQIWENE